MGLSPLGGRLHGWSGEMSFKPSPYMNCGEGEGGRGGGAAAGRQGARGEGGGERVTVTAIYSLRALLISRETNERG